MIRRRGAVSILVIYWIAILIGTHTPAEYCPPVYWSMDKFYHLLVYVVLALLALVVVDWKRIRGLGSTQRTGRSLAVWVLVLLIVAGIDEATQSFVPGRTPSVFDWIADGLGVLLGVAIYLCWQHRRLVVGRLSPPSTR